MKKILILISAIVITAYSQNLQTGDLSSYVDTYITNMPGDGTNAYKAPSSAALGTWGRIISDLIGGSYTSAHTRADSIAYQVIKYTDNSVSPNKIYYVLTKKSTGANYWGMFIYNPASSRAKLIIQSPHPKYDKNTGQQGFYIFENLGARAFMISGAHRCNSSDTTICDGTTDACGATGPYKISDQAHNVNATFQRSTEILLSTIPNLIFFQPHGFGQDAGDPDMIMSNGTRYTPASDFVVKLRDNLLTIDDTLAFKVIHVDTDWNKLTATTNVQGRLINGSAVNPCDINPSSANGRFIHVEQSYKNLRDYQSNWKKMSDALALTFPVTSSVVSGNWNSADTWMKGAVPSASDTVYIGPGHTVTVTSTTDSAANVVFETTTSKLSMSSGSTLNITGDFVIASETHQAISAWGAGAVIKFTGSNAVQTLKGWSTTGASTSLMDIVVDKPSGKVITGGTGMKFSFGNSLTITRGTFELATDDDIETRNLSNTATAAVINVQTGGILKIDGGDSYIRRGTNTDTLTSRIGKMTITGDVYFASTSASRINIGSIDVESGGELNLTTGWTGASGYFNPGIVTVKSGGTITSATTQTLWHSTSYLAIQTGAKLAVTSSAIGMPAQFKIDGDVEYSRTNIQTLSPLITNYNNLILSGTSAKTLGVSCTVSGTLFMSGKASLSLGSYQLTYGSSAVLNYNSTDQAQTTASTEFPSSLGPKNLTIDNALGVSLHAARTLTGSLSLVTGTLGNSTYNITMANQSLIRRANNGQLSAAPIYSGLVNIEYANTSGTLTTGSEIPASGTALNNLTLSGGQQVTLNKNITVNGILQLGGNILNTSGYTVSFSNAASNPAETGSGRIIGTAYMNTRSIGTGSLNFLGLALSGTGDIGNISISRFTGTPVSGSANQGIAVLWKISTSGSGPYLNRLASLSWFAADDNPAKSFSAMNKGYIWESTNSGADWWIKGSPLDISSANPRQISAAFTSQCWFTVSDSLHPLVPTLYSAVLAEGLWNGTSTITDTICAELHSGAPLYTTLTTSKNLCDSLGNIAFHFSGLQDSVNYYLAVKHRNSLETWSALPVTFVNKCKGYRFTDSAAAYLDNTTYSGGRYCLFSGDVNQDGVIDISDLILIDNDSNAGLTGYRSTDLDGNLRTEQADILICDYNCRMYRMARKPK